MLNLRRTPPITMIPSGHQGVVSFRTSKCISRNISAFLYHFWRSSVSLINRRSQGSCNSLLLFSYKVFQIFQSSCSQIGLLFNSLQWVCLWLSSRAYDGVSLNITEQCDLEKWASYNVTLVHFVSLSVWNYSRVL